MGFLDIFKRKKKVIQSKSTITPKVLDLSHHNKNIDFTKLSAYELIIIKATEGSSYIDPTFKERWKKIPVRKGAYHFFRCNKPWKEQADHFLHTVQVFSPDNVLALDFETCSIKGLEQSMGDLFASKDKALRFMEYVQEKTGILPWFYTYHGVIKEIQFGPEFAKFPLWYARYTSEKPLQSQGPWSKIHCWQYADNGQLPGISNDVDCNIFMG